MKLYYSTIASVSVVEQDVMKTKSLACKRGKQGFSMCV